MDTVVDRGHGVGEAGGGGQLRDLISSRHDLACIRSAPSERAATLARPVTCVARARGI